MLFLHCYVSSLKLRLDGRKSEFCSLCRLINHEIFRFKQGEVDICTHISVVRIHGYAFSYFPVGFIVVFPYLVDCHRR